MSEYCGSLATNRRAIRVADPSVLLQIFDYAGRIGIVVAVEQVETELHSNNSDKINVNGNSGFKRKAGLVLLGSKVACMALGALGIYQTA